jgi:SAM-dependent methyltransferase
MERWCVKILHAGCGGERLPPWLPIKGDEVRLDADENVKPTPDIVASIDNLGDIGPFDGVFCCHTLEHLHWYDAMKALTEFYRVLKPGGQVYIQLPDLEDIRPDNTVYYETVHGLKITGLDMHYGYRDFSHGNPWMMHRCGFMQHTLKAALEAAGFGAKVIRGKTEPGFVGFDLLGIGVKPE